MKDDVFDLRPALDPVCAHCGDTGLLPPDVSPDGVLARSVCVCPLGEDLARELDRRIEADRKRRKRRRKGDA